MKYFLTLLGLFGFTVAVGKTLVQTVSDTPNVVINEFSYYHPVGDRMDFIELKNNDTVPYEMSDFMIFLIDGPASVYNQLQAPALSGTIQPGGRFLIGSANGVPNPDITPFSEVTDNIKSDTGSISLVYLPTGLVDAVGYGTGITGAFEGNAINVYDSIPGGNSFSRKPDGEDTGDNRSDFDLVCMTPGSENSMTESCLHVTSLKINELELSEDSIYIEIYNPVSVPVSLIDYRIGMTPDLVSGYEYYFLHGVIQGNGYRVFNLGDSPGFEVNYALIEPTNEEFPFVDVIDDFTIGVELLDIPVREGFIGNRDSVPGFNFSRIPDGSDTGHNPADFRYVCSTIGAPNVNTTDCASGIEDEQLVEWSVYPNPTSGSVTIEFGDRVVKGVLEVRNALGQLVHTGSVANTKRWNAHLQLQSGIYLLQLRLSDGSTGMPIKLLVN